MRRLFLLALLVALVLPGWTAEWQPTEGRELIGRPAPEFDALSWLDHAPMKLADLKGKVVLVRFWMMGCQYCSPSMPALQKLSDRYASRGLVVIGIHHPKSGVAETPDEVRQAVRELKITYPIAMDNDWKTLRSYWLQPGAERSYTSSSFLIDRDGVIRWLHDGPELVDGPPSAHAWASLNHEIEALLR